MLLGDIIGLGRDTISHFLRTETNLSASSGTVLFSANGGINNDTDGGAGIVLRPDHHQDVGVWPGDPVNHAESGALLLNAYGQGSGSQANAIVLQTRGGPDTLTDRMLIKDGVVTVFGDVVATGSVTPGSSREFKQEIEDLSYDWAADLLGQLDAVSFVYTADPTQPRLGFIAEVVPEQFGTVDGKGVDVMGITATLTLVAQQQQQEIEYLSQLLTPLVAGLGVSSPLGHAGGGLATAEAELGDAGPVDQTTRESSTAQTGSVLVASAPGGSANGTSNGQVVQPRSGGSTAASAAAASSSSDEEVGVGVGALTANDAVQPFQIVETAGPWMRLEESGGTGWNIDHVSNAGLGIDSALSINVDGSTRDFYLADTPDGTFLYLWDDGLAVPDLPHTGIKPTLGVSGDMLVGDLITIERNPMTMFMREQTSLSASATTSLFSSRNGFGNDVDGGSAIVMHPDHHQDLTTFPGDPADHALSGSLELIAYGQGSGTYVNSIVLRTRSGPGTITDRMIVHNGGMSVIGNLVATGSITPGSSRELKQGIAQLDYGTAIDLLHDLNPVSFVYAAEPGQTRLGFIAEEVPEVFGTADQKGVDPMGILATLSVVVGQQQSQIAQLMNLVQASEVVDSGSPLAATQSVEPFAPSGLPDSVGVPFVPSTAESLESPELDGRPASTVVVSTLSPTTSSSDALMAALADWKQRWGSVSRRPAIYLAGSEAKIHPIRILQGNIGRSTITSSQIGLPRAKGWTRHDGGG